MLKVDLTVDVIFALIGVALAVCNRGASTWHDAGVSLSAVAITMLWYDTKKERT